MLSAQRSSFTVHLEKRILDFNMEAVNRKVENSFQAPFTSLFLEHNEYFQRFPNFLPHSFLYENFTLGN